MHKNKFLGKDPNDANHSWKEWEIQAYIVMELRRAGYIVHGDTNGASKTPKGWSQAKATGMLPGWPDMCLILERGPLWVELKVDGGVLSKEQKTLHEWMVKCGCAVHTVYADCPADGLEKVKLLCNYPVFTPAP